MIRPLIFILLLLHGGGHLLGSIYDAVVKNIINDYVNEHQLEHRDPMMMLIDSHLLPQQTEQGDGEKMRRTKARTRTKNEEEQNVTEDSRGRGAVSSFLLWL